MGLLLCLVLCIYLGKDLNCSTIHGCVSSCVGPIIDATMKCKVFNFDSFMIIQMRLVQRYVFLPSVYDALLVIRPSCNFRDGRVITNYTANLREYCIELPFNYSSMCKEAYFMRDIILGFTLHQCFYSSNLMPAAWWLSSANYATKVF